jgi:hypothetical protein
MISCHVKYSDYVFFSDEQVANFWIVAYIWLRAGEEGVRGSGLVGVHERSHALRARAAGSAYQRAG